MVTQGLGDYDAGMNSSLRRLALFLLTAAFFALVATGCQTTKGFGKDVKALGNKIEDKADH
jgi:predicted small secreted protein